MTAGAKTTRAFWDGTHAGQVRHRLPSRLNVGTANILRLLAARVPRGGRVLEIGFAPGKHLAYVAGRLGATVAGLDYSENGVAEARRLFAALGIDADLRCEDLFGNSFAEGSFDLVYSIGLVEHFDDPREAVRCHLALVAPGGRCILAVPHYGGLYGRLQRRVDPDNLRIHNLEIMSEAGMLALVPRDLVESCRAYPYGRPSPWTVSLERRWPGRGTRGLLWLANGLGLLQPVDIPSLCPMLVLEMRRRSAAP